jgi:signal transduction histidine kinase
MYDITEHRTLERLLQETNVELERQVAARTIELTVALEELRRADQLKDEFMAAVSHELRTPLTGVLGIAEALQEQYAGPLNERQLHYVHSIQESGAHLLSLVNSILHYTALMGGNVTARQEPCNLDELSAIAVRAVRPNAEKKGLTVELSVVPPDLSILSDGNGIIQVLKELLENAVKFTPDDGRVGLEIRDEDLNEGVRLTVWDTGIGIAPEQQATIFQPFLQGDARLARTYEGLGLGLAYARRMVELLGGSIKVESELGTGSRFIVTLPCG